MTVIDFPAGKPATAADLDPSIVAAALARHGCNVTDAAHDLGVPASDLRRLLWSNPQLQDQALETVEARLDTAERNIAEALSSDDSRRRDAASFFVVRNTARARRRGWITTSTSVAELNLTAVNPQRTITFRWRTSEDDERDAEAAEAERLRDEGKHVVSIGGGDPDDGKTIEHKAGPEPSNKD
jgi:hypothetical protein